MAEYKSRLHKIVTKGWKKQTRSLPYTMKGWSNTKRKEKETDKGKDGFWSHCGEKE